MLPGDLKSSHASQLEFILNDSSASITMRISMLIALRKLRKIQTLSKYLIRYLKNTSSAKQLRKYVAETVLSRFDNLPNNNVFSDLKEEITFLVCRLILIKRNG